MKTKKIVRVISAVLALALLVSVLPGVTTPKASAAVADFYDNFESDTIQFEKVSGTGTDKLKIIEISSGSYLSVPSGGNMYLLQADKQPDNALAVAFTAKINIGDAKGGNRFTIVYWYQDAKNWKGVQFFQNDEGKTYESVVVAMTEGITRVAGGDTETTVEISAAPTNGGQKLPVKNGGDEWLDFSLVMQSSDKMDFTLTRDGKTYTSTVGPYGGWSRAYRLGESEYTTDEERKEYLFDNKDIREGRFGFYYPGTAGKTVGVDNFRVRFVAKDTDPDELIYQIVREKHADVLALDPSAVSITDETAVRAYYAAIKALTANQLTYAKQDIAKADALLTAIEEKKMPERPTGADGDDIFFDFENPEDAQYWYVNTTEELDWGFKENPSKVYNTSNTAFYAPDNGSIAGEEIYTLHRNYWSKDHSFTQVSGKVYTGASTYWGGAVTIAYYYENAQNYKSIKLIRENGYIRYRLYSYMEGYAGEQGTAQSVAFLGDGSTGMPLTDTNQWMDFTISYNSDYCILTLDDGAGNTGSVTIDQNHTCYKTDNSATAVEEPEVVMNGQRFAFIGGGAAYYDDVRIQFSESADSLAVAFKLDHAYALGLSTVTVRIADKASVTNALQAFDTLTLGAKTILALEKKLLDDLAFQIENLEVMEGMGITEKAELGDGFADSFDSAASLNKWFFTEDSTNTELISAGHSFTVEPDAKKPDNSVLKVTGKTGLYQIRDFLWPEKAAMKEVSYRMKFDDAISVYCGTYLYYSYVDENNWGRIYIYRDVEEYYVWNDQRRVDGILITDPGKQFSPDFDFKDWVSVNISYNVDSLSAAISLTADSDPNNPVSIIKNMLSQKARFVIHSTNGSIYYPTGTTWYDDISIKFVAGDWDEDTEVKQPVVYYTSNTYMKPGDVAILYGENLGNTVAKAEIVRLSDAQDLPNLNVGYILQDSYYNKATEAEYTRALNAGAFFGSGSRELQLVQKSENTLKFLIPEDFSDGVYAVKLTPRDSASTVTYAYINAPVIDSVLGDDGDHMTAGGYVKISGKNLVINFTGDEVITDPAAIAAMGIKVQLKNQAGEVFTLPVIEVDSIYALTAQVPENLPNGNYEISVYNGYGGQSAWAVPQPAKVDVSVRSTWKTDVFDVTDFGADPAAEGNDTPGFVKALAAVAENGGGVVYVPHGLYSLVHTIVIPENVRFVGDGVGKSSIMFSPYHYEFGELPKAQVSFTKNVEIADVAFYAGRAGTMLYSEDPARSNIYIHDIYIQTSAIAGPATAGQGGQPLLNWQEVYNLAVEEAKTKTEISAISFKEGNGQNLQIKNCELTVSSIVLTGGNWDYADISNNTFHSSLTGGVSGELNQSVYAHNDTSHNGHHVIGRGLYFAHNSLQKSLLNNREMYTTDGTMWYGEDNRNGIVQKVDDTHYKIATGQKFSRNYWKGFLLYVLQGSGACQVRLVTESYDDILVIETPFVVEPNRNSRVGLHFNRINTIYYNNINQEGGNFGTYGTMVGAVFDSNTHRRAEGQSIWAYGDSPNWYLTIKDAHYYDGIFFHTSGEGGSTDDSSDYAYLKIQASGFANTNTAMMIKGCKFEDGARLQIMAPQGLSMRDLILDNNTFTDAQTAVSFAGGTTNIVDTVVYRNTFQNVDTTYAGHSAHIATKNDYNYPNMVMLKTEAESAEGFLWGDVNMDGTVTEADATMIKEYLTGKADFNEEQKKRADTNVDTAITVTDALLIQRYLLGEGELGKPSTPPDEGGDGEDSGRPWDGPEWVGPF